MSGVIKHTIAKPSKSTLTIDFCGRDGHFPFHFTLQNFCGYFFEEKEKILALEAEGIFFS